MWQKAVKPYVDKGELVAIGVVQEQHPDRTRLYRQWRELDWPIFVDSMNTLKHVTVVPIPMGIDENGIVVQPRFRPNQLDEFMKRKPERMRLSAQFNRVADPDIGELADLAQGENTTAAWLGLGWAYFNYGAEGDLDRAVDALGHAAKLTPSDGRVQFALGTALRRRYDSAFRQPGDAQAAVDHWGLALASDPNHYIWRRRLQQYGPRLDKPYNFYFWVERAREDIAARGEKPHELRAEPMGSELAPPQRAADAQVGAVAIANPDPEGKINRDRKALVSIEPLVTPARVQPGHRVRVRVTLRLDEEIHPLWNNEVDDLLLSVDLPEGLSLGESALTFAGPETPETRELRRLEFEVAVSEDFGARSVEIPAYALYYVCEDEGGVCLFLRNDFTIAFRVDADAPTLK